MNSKSSVSLPGFQKYLVDKGWVRYTKNIVGKEIVKIENYDSLFLSSYSPIEYFFSNNEIEVWWGLSERGKPPVMSLGYEKMKIISNNNKTYEDGYRILFSNWGENMYEKIYDVLVSTEKYFVVNCSDETNIIIDIRSIKIVGNIPCPQNWQSENDWDSHRELCF